MAEGEKKETAQDAARCAAEAELLCTEENNAKLAAQLEELLAMVSPHTLKPHPTPYAPNPIP